MTRTFECNPNISARVIKYKLVFKKGNVPWMKGKKHSAESKERLRLANLGRHHSQETIDKIKAFEYTPEIRNKMSSSHIGKLHSQESIEKIRITHLNDKNPIWKGENVGMDALHAWVTRHKPKPELCEQCALVPPYDLANISGKYLRDVNDFLWLCRRCHMNSDGRMKNLKQWR